MADSIMPPTGCSMGLRAPMLFTFTYDPPSPTDPKNIPVTFQSSDANVTFDQVMPVTTDVNTGQVAVVVTYKGDTDGVTVPLEVVDPVTLTPYISASYTTAWVNTGNLVVSPNAVPVAPDAADLGLPAYTITATAQFTSRGSTQLKYYPIGVEVVGNINVYDKNGNIQVVAPDGLYWFYSGPLGEAIEFKLSSLYEGIFLVAIKYGTGNLADNEHVVFPPELVGGDGNQFNLWSPLNLDAYNGALLTTTVVGNLDVTGKIGQPTVALVNGKLASAVEAYEALVQGFDIQKQAFVGASNYVISWMTTETGASLRTTQSNTVNPESVTGNTWLHPPTDGKLARPYTIGLSSINTSVLLKGDPSVYIPDLATGDEVTLVYFLNGYDPLDTDRSKAASFKLQVTATQNGTNVAKIPAGNLSGYAAHGREAGTFECYYYKGFGDAPRDPTLYSAPLMPILQLVTA